MFRIRYPFRIGRHPSKQLFYFHFSGTIPWNVSGFNVVAATLKTNQRFLMDNSKVQENLYLESGDNLSVKIQNSSESLFRAEGPSQSAIYTGSAVMFIALVAGLFGNVLVMSVIIKKKDLSNICNIFIISLCINDLINICLNNSLVLTSYVLERWPLGMLWCELSTLLTVILTGSSLWHTGLIAIHRLIVVVFNRFYKTISKKGYTAFLLVFCRVIPLLFLCQPSLGHMAEYEPKLLRCAVKRNYGPFNLLVGVFLMMFPSIIVIVCYVFIFIKVHQSSPSIRVQRQKDWLKREIRITKMFGVVFLLIMIGYIPYGIVRAVDKSFLLDADVYVSITVFFAVANCCNPIVYGVMDRNIKNSCLEGFGCWKGEERAPEYHNKGTMTIPDLPPRQLVSANDSPHTHLNML